MLSLEVLLVVVSFLSLSFSLSLFAHQYICSSEAHASYTVSSTKTESDYFNGRIKKQPHTQKSHPKWWTPEIQPGTQKKKIHCLNVGWPLLRHSKYVIPHYKKQIQKKIRKQERKREARTKLLLQGKRHLSFFLNKQSQSPNFYFNFLLNDLCTTCPR